MPFADKTANIYRLTREEYQKILNDSITATYKKANNNIKKKINADGKQVLRNSKVLKKMQNIWVFENISRCLFYYIYLKVDEVKNFQQAHIPWHRRMSPIVTSNNPLTFLSMLVDF